MAQDVWRLSFPRECQLFASWQSSKAHFRVRLLRLCDFSGQIYSFTNQIGVKALWELTALLASCRVVHPIDSSQLFQKAAQLFLAFGSLAVTVLLQLQHRSSHTALHFHFPGRAELSSNGKFCRPRRAVLHTSSEFGGVAIFL